MDNFSKSREQQLEDRLSEFTDLVLSQENEADMQQAINQDELAELQKTILRMKAATQKARASGNADIRIRNRLQMEWKKSRQAERPAPKRFTWNWTFPRLALTGGLVALILFGVVKYLPTTNSLAGAAEKAGGSSNWSPLFIFAGIVIIVILLWHNRHD